MQIVEVKNVDVELVCTIQSLVSQLSSSAKPPEFEQISSIVNSQCSKLLLTVEKGTILGTLTLVMFRIPTGFRAWIEDVVVDEAARRKGVGTSLNEYALDIAKQAGARTVDLTSRETREAANRMYLNLGFNKRNTNVYRYEMSV